MLTTIVLFKGLNAPAMQIITLVMGFLVICTGITILQLSKIDPTQIKMLDRRSTVLLQAANAPIHPMDGVDDEKSITAMEDPGLDALRGAGFGVVGSIVRARTARRWSKSSQSTARSRHGQHPNAASIGSSTHNQQSSVDPLHGVRRHQLYDAPVPRLPDRGSQTTMTSSGEGVEHISMTSEFSAGTPRSSSARPQTIKFGNEDIVHSYPKPGSRAKCYNDKYQ